MAPIVPEQYPVNTKITSHSLLAIELWICCSYNLNKLLNLKDM